MLLGDGKCVYNDFLIIKAIDSCFKHKKLNEIITHKHTHLWSDPPHHLKVPQSLDLAGFLQKCSNIE